MSDRVDLPIPVTEDPETAGFWEAASRGYIGLLHCGACGSVLHLPVPYCNICHSSDTEWRDVSPRGRVYSHTVVEHQVHPAFPTPYTIVLVELDDAPGVRLVGWLEGRVPLRAGEPMVGAFETRDGVAVPNWARAG